MLRSPYSNGRRLADGFPGLAHQALETYVRGAQERANEATRIAEVMADLDALVDVGSLSDLAVIGCGPWPVMIDILADRGYRVIGVEPVPSFVNSARRCLGAADLVLQGSAEHVPLADASCDVVFLESVLEHVESPRLALEETYRILRPGGVAIVVTTNRHALNLERPEFNVPLYGWLPRALKESYVFFHLHYRPSLANHTERPAVHWFSYADLCALGRNAGFAQFYSYLDLRREQGVVGGVGSRVRAALRRGVRRSPLLRTLALTQRGGDLFMLKRVDASSLAESSEGMHSGASGDHVETRPPGSS